MTLTKQQQNGLLFILYVRRSGRCKTKDVANYLGLSSDFLEQIARNLRRCGHLVSFRGPGGGYEVVGDPTVGEVVWSLGKRRTGYRQYKLPEQRALGQLVDDLLCSANPVLKQRLSSYTFQVLANEHPTMGTFN